MKRLLTILSLCFVFACGADRYDARTSVDALHAWSTYHWPGDNLDPTVYDNTKDSYWSGVLAVDAFVSDWITLGTAIQPTNSSARKADVSVGEGRSTQWLGLAQISIDSEGHIQKGKVTLNTRVLKGDPRFTSAASAKVLCQELGHIWGLGHNRTELNTCMNDCQAATTEAEWLACLNDPTGETPNTHDAEELNVIYGHVDPPGDDSGGKGGPPCSVKPNHPNCTGQWITVHGIPIR